VISAAQPTRGSVCTLHQDRWKTRLTGRDADAWRGRAFCDLQKEHFRSLEHLHTDWRLPQPTPRLLLQGLGRPHTMVQLNQGTRDACLRSWTAPSNGCRRVPPTNRRRSRVAVARLWHWHRCLHSTWKAACQLQPYGKGFAFQEVKRVTVV
jgi:hypothetical protein